MGKMPMNTPVVTGAVPSASMKSAGFGFEYPDGLSVVQYPLYSRVPLAAGVAVNELDTFIGTGVQPGTAVARTDVDSNVTQPFQLPQDWFYAVHGFTVRLIQPAIATSVDTDLLGFQNGIAQLIIGESNPYTLPISSAGGGGGFSGIGQGVAGSAGTALLQNGNGSINDYFRLMWEYGLSWPIDGGNNFNIKLKWSVNGTGYTPVVACYVLVTIYGFAAVPPDSL